MPELFERLQQALVDRYAVERELGAGGMATVYLARDVRHDRAVALKVLRPELAAALGPERFLREIRTTAQLAHPHILPLLDSGEADGTLFYVMPYVEGESLRGRLEREKQLPLDDALQTAREVADALSYAHSHGVIHRDIKPENILLQGGHAVVADFGIARAVSAAGGSRLTETGLAIGTPAYMSPEQASGSKDLDGRSDLYSLGCVLYEMLSGDAPYVASTPQAVIAKKLSEPLPRISVVRETVPPGIEAAIAKALARTPADRFVTASEFAAALAHPETMGAGVQAPRRWWRRRAWRVASVGAVLVVTALAMPLVVRGRRPSLDPTAVVVAPFENQIRDTALAQLGAIAADWLVQVLQATGDFRVVPTSEVAATKWVPGTKVQDLAAGTGAGTVITGRTSLQGDSIYLRADVVDGRSGALLGSVPAVIAGRQQPLEAVKELARRAAGAAGEILHPGVIGESEVVRLPASYEVYRELAEAERQEAAGANPQAWRHFERAYALDTAFLRAPLEAGIMHMNAGDYAAADSLWRFLEARRDRLTRFEQLVLEAQSAWTAGELQRAAAAEREASQLEPPGAQTANWGYFALATNHPGETIHALAEVAKDYPLGRAWPPHWWYLAGAYHVLGRHQDELRVAKRGRQLFPASLSVLGVELRARAALGQEDEVVRLLGEAHGMTPDPSLANEIGAGVGFWQPYEAALEFRAHGYPDAYRRAIARAEDALAATSAGDTTTTAARWSRAAVSYAAERWEEARTSYAELQAADPTNIEFLGGLGTSEARLGHREAAAAVGSRLAHLDRPYSYGRTQYWRARIAAVLGDRDGAVTLLRQALSAGFACTYHEEPLTEACHRDIDFERLRGYPPFDELMRPKG